MMRLATYFVSGLIFAVGLVVGGMTQPQKIIGFLDIFGNWDPSLAGVMFGAVLVHSISYRLIMRRARPIFEPRFLVPKRSDIDASLVVGAGLFGIGWGLGGYCPGPGIVAVGGLVPDAVVFLASTVTGHWLYGWYARWLQSRAAQTAESRPDPNPAAT